MESTSALQLTNLGVIHFRKGAFSDPVLCTSTPTSSTSLFSIIYLIS